jgi:hypothetical protein
MRADTGRYAPEELFERQHISMPTTIVLRRSGAEWKVALIHSAPLPEAG